MMDIPYIFFDNREELQPWFVKILRAVSESQEIYVITRAARTKTLDRENIHFVNISELGYFPRFNEFKEKYVHLSTHSIDFELSCFERYFAIESLMELNQFTTIWHLDTDVFPTEHLKKYNQFDLVFSSPYADNSVVSAHTSKFSRHGINEFTEFLIHEFYADHLQVLQKFYDLRIEDGLSGGICDMQGLAFWLRIHRQGQWMNSFGYNGKDLSRINHTIANLAEELPLNKYVGPFLVSRHEKYLQLFTLGASNAYATLHFQGQFKYLIPNFLRFRFLVGNSKSLLFQTKILVKLNLIKMALLKREPYSRTRIPVILRFLGKK